MSAEPKISVSDLPLEEIMRLARVATQRAACKAVAAGRAVAGWRDDRLELLSHEAGPLSSEPLGPGGRPQR